MKYGDDLSRFRSTVVRTNREQARIIGIEVGHGGPGLRVVYPVFLDGARIGSVEFGASIESVLRAIQDATGLDYAVGIDRGAFEKAGRLKSSDSDIRNGNLVY